MISWRLTRDTVTPALRAAFDALRNRRPMMVALGKRLERVLRDWFQAKQRMPSQRALKGWPTQHFWDRRIRNATAFAGATDRTAVVSISDPAFAAHYLGTTIKPKEKKFLALPLTAFTYGKRPSANLIPGVFLVKLKNDGALLLARKPTGSAKLQWLWRLVPRVTIPKDALAAPPATQVNEALNSELNSFLTRTVRRAAGASA